MATPDIPTTWKQADAILARARNRDSGRTVANNTRLEDGYPNPDCIHLQLHGSNVATYHPDGSISVSLCGWDTVTTRDRISRALPSPWNVWRHKDQPWMFHSGYPMLPLGNDGLRVGPKGIMLPDGTRLMSNADIDAETAREKERRAAAHAKHAENLAAQHERGERGQYGSTVAYLVRDSSGYSVLTWQPYRAECRRIVVRTTTRSRATARYITTAPRARHGRPRSSPASPRNGRMRHD